MADKHEETTFESADAGASTTFPMQCSALRIGGHVMIKSRPCKIISMSTSKTGKHGHAKVNLTGIDIFTGKKYEDLSPSTHNMEVPVVKRTEYMLLSIDDGFLSMMTEDGQQKEDVKAPAEGELRKQIDEKLEAGDEILVTIVAACGEEQAISIKTKAE
ncbi:translation elongation factor eIF-5A [Coemansia nantahalensis]|uniref:Translation elongation factor eIF-5A n=2 Tax=Coemansia TaxID=4863 RepID=A0ACC1KFN3_9FUNG|nr:translation elongation factor eIF-5A [Coemansia nantahalensis]KAJ2771600.1 translation elongation factor eIF-5A [Coemansia nantahalensis]KAJ2789118.1 translation elongation factor eIF-5A [Coemansia helicoidea]